MLRSTATIFSALPGPRKTSGSVTNMLQALTAGGCETAQSAQEGILLAPVSDLVRMKLTSFRLRDKTHVIDMDSVGLITPEIEAALSDPLRRRLQQVREEEAQSTGAE